MQHYRICHKCDHLNQSEQTIERCEKCRCYFARFYFCNELEEFLPDNKRIQLIPDIGKSRTIVGLSFKWTD